MLKLILILRSSLLMMDQPTIFGRPSFGKKVRGILHENKGLRGGARKAGIQAAKGEFFDLLTNGASF